jgi:hypothetical protein
VIRLRAAWGWSKLVVSARGEVAVNREEEDSLKGEAQAQSEETLMPWIWGGVGLVIIALFVAWTIFGASLDHMREPPGAAPTFKPAAQHY